MRQEERRQPARSRPMGEPEKDGIKRRIEECRKGADHDQHLKGDSEVQDDGGPEESTRLNHTQNLPELGDMVPLSAQPS